MQHFTYDGEYNKLLLLDQVIAAINGGSGSAYSYDDAEGRYVIVVMDDNIPQSDIDDVVNAHDPTQEQVAP
jgi:hypothetical protein